MNDTKKPSILLVYHSYTGQTLKVAQAMAEVLTSRGADVTLAPIEFIDPRYAPRFDQFPMKRPYLELFGMVPAELARDHANGEIRIPPSVTEREYDFVLVASHTWWLSTNVPIRAFMESDTAAKLFKDKPFAIAVVCRRYWKHNFKTVRRLGEKHGGRFVDGIHFKYEGGQVFSMMALLGFMSSGKVLPRYLGIPIPPTNIQPYHVVEARAFADRLADGMVALDSRAAGDDTTRAFADASAPLAG